MMGLLVSRVPRTNSKGVRMPGCMKSQTMVSVYRSDDQVICGAVMIEKSRIYPATCSEHTTNRGA